MNTPLSANQQTATFSDELDKLVHYFRYEYEVSYAEIVGSLFVKAHFLTEELRQRQQPEHKDE